MVITGAAGRSFGSMLFDVGGAVIATDMDEAALERLASHLSSTVIRNAGQWLADEAPAAPA